MIPLTPPFKPAYAGGGCRGLTLHDQKSEQTVDSNPGGALGGSRSALALGENEKESIMDSYRCTACGYIYDTAIGDSDGGIPQETDFSDLPEDWVCPLCMLGKDVFEKI